MTPPQSEPDPNDEPATSGLKSLTPFELALFLGAILASVIIWVIFILIHR
jgi:hypothetical protein